MSSRIILVCMFVLGVVATVGCRAHSFRSDEVALCNGPDLLVSDRSWNAVRAHTASQWIEANIRDPHALECWRSMDRVGDPSARAHFIDECARQAEITQCALADRYRAVAVRESAGR